MPWTWHLYFQKSSNMAAMVSGAAPVSVITSSKYGWNGIRVTSGVSRRERTARSRSRASSTVTSRSVGALPPGPRVDAAAAGDAVEHDRFGIGTVIAVIGEGLHAVARVCFGPQKKIKRLQIRYAPMRKVGI
ncbi:hypothetical protein ACWEKM_37360 [Streptomyces sp. NPDC004752]